MNRRPTGSLSLAKAIPAPKFEQAPIEPFTKEEVERLLKACEQCNEAKTTDRRKYITRRATGRRDQAIIMTLLDTGLRAGEEASAVRRRKRDAFG